MKLRSEQILQSGLKYTKELQITLDDDFNVADAKPDIDSIVREWGNVYVDAISVNDMSAQIKGTLDFALLYSGKSDTQGLIIPVKMTGDISFTEMINLPEDKGQGSLSCVGRIDDLTIKAINSRKVSVKAIATLIVSCYSEEWKEFGCQVEHDTDDEQHGMSVICTKDKKLIYTEMCVNLKDNLRIRKTISLPSGRANIGDVKWEDLSVRNLNSHMTDDGIIISGDLAAFIMYEPETELQKIQWYEGSTGFEEKLDISGCSEDMVSFVKYHAVSCSVEPKANYDGEMRDLNLELVLELDVKGYLDKEKYIIEDIYSPTRGISVKSEDVELSHLVTRNNSRCKVNSSVSINDSNMLQIINCTGTVQIDSVREEDSAIMVEGVLLAGIMYVTAVDNSPIRSVSESIPFSQKIAVNKGTSEVVTGLETSVENISAVMTGSGEILIKGSVAVDVVCFENVKTRAITECEYEDFDEEAYLKFPGIVGFMSDGKESLWTIAKNNHTTVEAVIGENANLSEHCDSDYIVPVREKLILIKEAAC